MPKIILFICYGNTCRSPMMAAIFQEALGPDYLCISAGAGHSTTAPDVYHNAFEALSRIGIGTIADAKTKAVTEEMLEKADMVFCLGREIHEEIIDDFVSGEALEDFTTGKAVKGVASLIDEKKILQVAPEMLKFYDPFDGDGYTEKELKERGLVPKELPIYIDVAEKIRDIFVPRILAKYFPEKLPAWQERIKHTQPKTSLEASGGMEAASLAKVSTSDREQQNS